MLGLRLIPCLLLKGDGLVKTIRFAKYRYLGDPINVVRIFNDKEVDELIFLDIRATTESRPPPFETLEKIASECFMPLCYGGGVRALNDMQTLFSLGVEKVAINTAAAESPELVRAAASRFGSQSVVVSIDVRKRLLKGFEVYSHGGTRATGWKPEDYAARMERLGAGELLLTSIDRDGTYLGYDLELVRRVSRAVSIPVIACGGAAGVKDVAQVTCSAGASAAAAGSMFVYQGLNRGVLISYPAEQDLRHALDLEGGAQDG